MNKLKIALLALLLATIAACGGGSSSSESSNNSNVRNVVAIGDSIGVGFGGVNAWPDLVRAQTGFPLVNSSRAGRNASFALSSVVNAINNENPSHILVLLGTNDSNRGSVAAATAAMREIVNFAIGSNVIPIIGTVPPRNSRSRQISANYRALGAPIADVEAAFGSGDGLFQRDGIHPNNAGQQIIADTFVNALNRN